MLLAYRPAVEESNSPFHMRLLNVKDLVVEKFLGKEVPTYAILSHTWENEEITFDDVENLLQPELQKRKGYNKLSSAIRQATRDGYEYLWADTCCIDKSTSAELSE